jgi:hypothetical protein
VPLKTMRLWRIALFLVLGAALPAAAQPSRVVTLWASGRIARFDVRRHVLVIMQGTHEMTFSVEPDTRLEREHQPQPPDELSSDIGCDVRINYVTISGTRIARRVLLVIVPH